MRVLALDQATSCGWATNAGGPGRSRLEWGTEEFGRLRPDDGDGQRLVRFRGWLWEKLSRTGAALVVSEGLVGFSRGKANLLAPQFSAVVRMAVAELGLTHAEVPPSTLKKFATGRGNAKKPDVTAAARARARSESKAAGWIPMEVEMRIDSLTDDEADALWLLWWGVDRWRR